MNKKMIIIWWANWGTSGWWELATSPDMWGIAQQEMELNLKYFKS